MVPTINIVGHNINEFTSREGDTNRSPLGMTTAQGPTFVAESTEKKKDAYKFKSDKLEQITTSQIQDFISKR